jgi:hypothetical protein
MEREIGCLTRADPSTKIWQGVCKDMESVDIKEIGNIEV